MTKFKSLVLDEFWYSIGLFTICCMAFNIGYLIGLML